MKVNNDLITHALIAVKDGDKDKLIDLFYNYKFIADVNTKDLDVEFSNKNGMTLYEFFDILTQEVGGVGDNQTN